MYILQCTRDGVMKHLYRSMGHDVATPTCTLVWCARTIFRLSVLVHSHFRLSGRTLHNAVTHVTVALEHWWCLACQAPSEFT